MHILSSRDFGGNRILANFKMSTSGCVRPSVPFRADRIPLTPRTNTLGPYGRPQLPVGGAGRTISNDSRRAMDGIHERPIATRQESNTGGNASDSPTCLQQIMEELQQGREEQRKFRDDIKKMGHIITRLEEEYRKLNDQLKEQIDAAFTVETSGLKVSMMP